MERPGLAGEQHAFARTTRSRTGARTSCGAPVAAAAPCDVLVVR